MEKVVHGVDSAPVLVTMTVPKSSDLFCFTARIDPEDIKDPSARSDFHWQTFKCRLLVFSAPVLACPVRAVDGPLRDLTVVCRRAEQPEQQPAEVRAKLAELNLRAARARPVSDSEYASCLEYTMQAKLAPLWSPLAQRLVQGKDFLACGAPRDSVSVHVNVSGELGVAWVSLTCCRLRLAPLNLPDLDVSVPVLETFHQDPLGHIPELSIGQPWVHVLPSLKRGLIVGISKTMPEETPFRRYKDLRRHWKNMYGYRLSEEPAAMYCSVYFRALGGVPMTYPWPCLTPRMPSALRCLDLQAVVLSFLADVAIRMPTVCGEPSPVAVDCLTTTATLCTAAAAEAQYEAAAGDPNGSAPPPRPNLRPLALGENNSPSPPRNQDTDDESVASTCPLSMATQRDGSRPNVDWNFLKRAPRGDENKENNPPEANAAASTRVVPVFRARAPIAAEARAVPTVPHSTWFRPSATSSPQSPGDSTPAAGTSASSSTVPRSSPSANTTPSSVASREPVSPASTAAAAAAPVVPVFRIPANKPIFLPRLKVAAAKPRAPAKQASPKTTTSSARASPKASAKASPKASGGVRGPKRASTDSPLVPELASEDAVRRASVPILQAWLRDKGVTFRSKHKKADLVEKAIEHLAVLRRT